MTRGPPPLFRPLFCWISTNVRPSPFDTSKSTPPRWCNCFLSISSYSMETMRWSFYTLLGRLYYPQLCPHFFKKGKKKAKQNKKKKSNNQRHWVPVLLHFPCQVLFCARARVRGVSLFRVCSLLVLLLLSSPCLPPTHTLPQFHTSQHPVREGAEAKIHTFKKKKN